MLYEEVKPRLHVHKGVYKPLEEARMVGHLVEELAFGKVLDMGTGTGILGIIAAKKRCNVTFADVNPAAIECARENARKLRVKGKFLVTDLFSNVRGKYNVIVFNVPFLKSVPLKSRWYNPATDGGRRGREVLDRFLEEYKKHVLKRHLVLVTEGPWNHSHDDVKRLNARIAAKLHYPFIGDYVVLAFE